MSLFPTRTPTVGPGSDVDPLTDLIGRFGSTIVQATATLRTLVAECPDRTGLTEELARIEHEGDRIAHDVIRHLRLGSPGPWPFDAEDGYRLTGALDDVVDATDAAGDMLAVYRVEAPTDQATRLAELLVAAGAAVDDALQAFCAGDDAEPHLVRIHRLENEADRTSRDAIGSLFVDGLDPLFVIRWKDIYTAMEDAIDDCERVAHVLAGIELKRRGATSR
ncbi:MAG: DUF47 family protein [Solirubrobacteraceae bacterium]|nr:DUF47 family protein [Solirubrobacteraceae bacterium]